MGKLSIGLAAIFAIAWSTAASAENTTNKNSSAKANTAPPAAATRSNTAAPAQRINNIVNYNAVKTNQNPGSVNRITSSGTQPMAPNAQSQYGRGLRSNPVPSPTATNPNARYNNQGRNMNPTGDRRIAAGFDANQKRYQASQSKSAPTTSASTTRSWPGPTRPASAVTHPSTTPAPAPVRAAAAAPARSAPPPPPSRSYTTASSTTTTKPANNKKP